MGKLAVVTEDHPWVIGGVHFQPGIHPVNDASIDAARHDGLNMGNKVGDDKVVLFDDLREIEGNFDNDTLMDLIEKTLKHVEQKDGSMTSVIRRMQQLARGFQGNSEVIEFIRDYKRQFEGQDPVTGQEFTVQL